MIGEIIIPYAISRIGIINKTNKIDSMAKVKLSITIEAETFEKLLKLKEKSQINLSAWIDQAIRERLSRELS